MQLGHSTEVVDDETRQALAEHCRHAASTEVGMLFALQLDANPFPSQPSTLPPGQPQRQACMAAAQR